MLTDTVGFVQDLPHTLVAAFKGTLAEAAETDVLLHVIDVSAPEPETQAHVTIAVLKELGAGTQPTLYVLNKTDMLRGDIPESLLDLQPQVQTSLATGHGIDAIVDWIRHQVAAKSRTRTIVIPLSRPDLIRMAEATAVRPGRWSAEAVEYDVAEDDAILAQLAG